MAVALAFVACGYDAKTVPMGMSGTPAGGSGNSTATTGSSMTSGSSTATAGSGSSVSTGSGGSGDVVGLSGTPGGTGAASGASAGSSGATASGMSSGTVVGMGAKNPNLTYTKVTVHTRFLAESLAIADFDHDGNLDIASGRNWYAGPNWAAPASQHIYRDGHGDLPVAGDGIEINTGVSDSWSAYAFDVNGDGWDDIIQISASDMGPQEAYSAQNTVMAKSANPA
ncbi:MAG TPA: VCBS repeat-containing protein, partial [Polyangiaceae bacterium]|nr:VCBS repeat-containing protein [Polyangiaceae bacterium]